MPATKRKEFKLTIPKGPKVIHSICFVYKLGILQQPDEKKSHTPSESLERDPEQYRSYLSRNPKEKETNQGQPESKGGDN